MTDFRIAVLIDADNVSHQYAGVLLEELAKFGRTTVKRAYADWTGESMKGWKDKLNRHAISPEQTFAYTRGKNSTDSALIIDAMDLLYSGNVDGFAIVSSDSDFTRLANRLRESGKTVYGVGREKTARALQEACDQFLLLELLGTADEAHEPAAASETPADADEAPADADEAPELPNLHSLLTRAVNNAAGEDGWANLSSLGTNLRRLFSAFEPKRYGYSGLLPLVEEQHFLTLDRETQRVGLKGQVTVAKAPAKKAPAKKAAATKAAQTKTAQSKG
ncbi:NYN domain-containing protein [Nocardioides carbamazepini]|uniref:NYN domain-containing protein n=1 Tax=Nocardioides carbamazepini TaxID=2854259 RepID=UPI00214A7952|nr:NYN domain-containing protein [Nocardioides carbamazepini]MCR1786538.1 NYN domain-containing protein [Nocardioides carbamazepini]